MSGKNDLLFASGSQLALGQSISWKKKSAHIKKCLVVQKFSNDLIVDHSVRSGTTKKTRKIPENNRPICY